MDARVASRVGKPPRPIDVPKVECWCPHCLELGTGQLWKGAQQLRQRINQSVVFRFYAQRNRDANTRTHKNENSISIILSTLDHLVIFIICSLAVYERLGVVTKVEF